MKKFKVATIVGTRPEIIRLSRIIPRIDKTCEQTLIHTGQNYDYELNDIFFKDLNIRPPDIFLNASRKTPAATVGRVISETERILSKLMPDAVLILGDTNSCVAAYSAKRLKIPIFHFEAGNRCFDMRVPEEINRKVVDHIADVNLTYSSIAREYLLREGLKPDLVIKIGSPMAEVLSFYKSKINSSKIISTLKLKAKQYFLVSIHREENIESDKSFFKICTSLNKIAEIHKLPIILSTHPRTRKKIEKNKIKFNNLIQLLKPMSFTDYNKLQIKAKTVLSDSGTITEESSILGFPALNLREAHERPEGMEEASVIMVGLESERILQGINIVSENNNIVMRQVNDYESLNVSEKVLRIIISYTDYVKRVVWNHYE